MLFGITSGIRKRSPSEALQSPIFSHTVVGVTTLAYAPTQSNTTV